MITSTQFWTPLLATMLGAVLGFVIDLRLICINNCKKEKAALYEANFIIEKIMILTKILKKTPPRKREDAFPMPTIDETEKEQIYSNPKNERFFNAIQYGSNEIPFTIPNLPLKKLMFLTPKNTETLDNIMRVSMGYESLITSIIGRNAMIDNRADKPHDSNSITIPLSYEDEKFIGRTEIMLKILKDLPNDCEAAINSISKMI